LNPSRLWPLGIVAVLALTVGANAWIYYQANRDPNGTALESDYYRKAVAYDSTLAQAGRDSVLDWRLDVAPGAYVAGRTPLAVSLADRDGHPLAGARIGLSAIHNLDAGRTIEAAFVTGADGRATAMVALDRPGLWELRFDAHHGDQRFTADLRRDVEAGR